MMPLLGICSEELKAVIRTSTCAPVFRAKVSTVAKCGNNTDVLHEGGAPSRTEEWALVYHSVMNCPRTHTHWQSKRLYWEGTLGQGSGGYRNPGGLLCHSALCLRFYDYELVSGVFGQSFWHSLYWWCVQHSAKRDSSQKGFWEVGKTNGLESPLSFWLFPNSSSWW